LIGFSTACDYSGGYFNPVLATSLKLNCPGNTLSEHFIVYWLGSIAGSVASWWLYRKPEDQQNFSIAKEKIN
jgi:aquaporin related protein